MALVSHDQHADNLDAAGRALLSRIPLTLTTPEGAARLGGGAVGPAWWEPYEVRGVVITPVPAQHGPAEAVPVVGPVSGFVISSPGSPTIYVSGDTVPFEGTEAIVARYAGSIDYALLHAGSVAEGEDALTYFTMTASEAVTLAQRLDAHRFSIIHADSWGHFREPMPAALAVARDSVVSERLLDLSGRGVVALGPNG